MGNQKKLGKKKTTQFSISFIIWTSSVESTFENFSLFNVFVGFF